jgi:hypothetical protein
MDNHPIPQDVTGFKFKLIGSITVRQFAYLLFCAIFAYIFFALPIFLLIKIPFIIFFAVLGFMLAFVPIDGRPMDLMLMNFLKAIPRDNQWVYHKKGVDLSFLEYHGNAQQTHQQALTHTDTSEKQRKLTLLLQSRQNQVNDLEQHEVDFLSKMKGFFPDEKEPQQNTTQTHQVTQADMPAQYPALPIQQVPMPLHPQAPQTVPMPAKTEHSVNDITMSANPTLTVTTPPKPDTPVPLPAQPTPHLAPKPEPPKAMPEPIRELQQEVASQAPEIVPAVVDTPTEPSAPHEAVRQVAKEINHEKATGGKRSQDTSRVRVLAGDDAVNAGFPTLPDIPNIIIGIVKDPRGKVMSNILVEVFDKNDIPVRAFKTNPLGQFASATPLPNGQFTIRLEDPLKQHEFDTIEITLSSEIFQPLEVISIDQREKLRLDLFG